VSDFVYVDNSNLYIEGRRVSAVANKDATDIYEAMREGILDQAYTISFGKLYDFLVGTTNVDAKRVAMWGSRPPPNDGIWNHATRAGFELNLEDRNVRNKEKKIDTAIATQMTKDAFKNATLGSDTFTLVSGDADYVPTVKVLVEEGFSVDVVFWGHAAKELQSVATRFISLDERLEDLRL